MRNVSDFRKAEPEIEGVSAGLLTAGLSPAVHSCKVGFAAKADLRC